MATLLATFTLLSLAILGLSLSALISKKQIRGTCSTTGEDCACTTEAKQNCKSYSQL